LSALHTIRDDITKIQNQLTCIGSWRFSIELCLNAILNIKKDLSDHIKNTIIINKYLITNSIEFY